MEIKDSGDRREFGTGAVRDMAGGKGRMDLLPWAAIMEVAKHCENGALKYGEHNVDKGIPVHSFLDSAARHLAKVMDGWDDEPHLLAAAWNLLFAIQMQLKFPNDPKINDIPWNKTAETNDTFVPINPNESADEFIRKYMDKTHKTDSPIDIIPCTACDLSAQSSNIKAFNENDHFFR